MSADELIFGQDILKTSASVCLLFIMWGMDLISDLSHFSRRCPNKRLLTTVSGDV